MGIGGVAGKLKAFAAMVSLQFGYAGMYIVTTICLKRGMNHFVLSVYRHVFATIAISPFAFFIERKTRPKMTISVFIKIMLLGLLEPVIDQNLYYVGLKETSATFASASINVLPAITFILATIFRLEKVDIRKIPSQAKIAGTIVTVGGAMVMTLYKGPIVDLFFFGQNGHHAAAASSASGQHWVAGTLLLLGKYPAELSLTALVCVMGSVQGAAVTLVVNRDMSAWELGWDSRLLASAYSGVVCSGIAYYVQGVVNRERGPVFVTAFSPLCMIITAILGSLILAEKMHLGSIIGAVIIITGLYTVVWGKSKDRHVTDASMIDVKGKVQELPISQTTRSILVDQANLGRGGAALSTVGIVPRPQQP
ncbi:hypothetical protein V2J09_004336 [Rumex salicifolius]